MADTGDSRSGQSGVNPHDHDLAGCQGLVAGRHWDLRASHWCHGTAEEWVPGSAEPAGRIKAEPAGRIKGYLGLGQWRGPTGRRVIVPGFGHSAE
jgi:hypothetical protein